MESSPYLLYQWLPLTFLALFLTSVSAIPLNITRLEGRQLRSHGIVSRALPEHFKTFSYPQTVDHFNYRPESYEIFKQRYIVFDKFWDKGDGAKRTAPIFAYLGDENLLESRVGFFTDSAMKFKALLVYIEHRYYGVSIPFARSGDTFKDSNTLGYLNSAQALADYAEILIHIKEKYNARESPIIVFGGSYGGMLAAWFRLKYPHIALGALASSAPILYFDDVMRQNKVALAISKKFKEVSNTCYQTIKKSWSEIDKAASTPEGLTHLSERFKTCRELRHGFELKKYLESVYTDAAQSGQPLVKKICQKIDDTHSDKDGTISKIFAAVVAASSDGTVCYVNPLQSEIDRAFKWQKCSEMVMPKGQGGRENMFEPDPPNQMDLVTEECRALYGVVPRSHWITTYYGGHNMKSILKSFGSNIIFSNGLKDPYSHGGVLEDISSTIFAVVMEEGGHCEDIYPNKNTDLKWLAPVIRNEFDIIQRWINQYDTDRKSSSN